MALAVVGQFKSLAFDKALEILDKRLQYGDVLDETFRQFIIADLDDIKQSLDAIRNKEFEAAKTHLKTALTSFREGNIDTSEFREARVKAVLAFSVVKTLPEKIEATKIAAMSAVYEFGDDKKRAKTYSAEYVENLMCLPELHSVVDVKSGRGFGRRVKGLFWKTSRNDVMGEFFSCTRSLTRYLSTGTVVNWPVKTTSNGATFHPLFLCLEVSRITSGDECSCETTPKVSDVAQSVSLLKWWKRNKDGNLELDETQVDDVIPISGDGGFNVVINVYAESRYLRIESIHVTDPGAVESSLEIRNDMEGTRDISSTIRGNLMLLYTGRFIYLYEIGSGKRLWVDREVEGVGSCNLEWRCDQHAQLINKGKVNFTINMWS